MGSINTNLNASIGLGNLNQLGVQQAQNNKRVSTGLKVADAFDNGAVFAIAQGLRSDVSGLSAVNGQLGGALGSVNVAAAAATNVSNSLSDVRDTLIQLSDQNLSANARSQLTSQYNTQVSQIQSQIGGATYNGTNLISAGAQNQSVIQDVNGGQFTIQAQDLNAGVASQLTPVANAAQAQSLLQGGLANAQSNVGTALNSFAASSAQIQNQLSFNSSVSDATDQGLGALVDANLPQAAALQQSNQVRQQLAIQTQSIANASPSVVLNLFR